MLYLLVLEIHVQWATNLYHFIDDHYTVTSSKDGHDTVVFISLIIVLILDLF